MREGNSLGFPSGQDLETLKVLGPKSPKVLGLENEKVPEKMTSLILSAFESF